MVKPLTEPHCPARLARFRLECGPNVIVEPERALPCVESIERPGRCVHCYQAIERAAGAPHGPYCTGDSRCRECARVLREASPRVAEPPHVFGGLLEPEAPPLSPAELDALRTLARDPTVLPSRCTDHPDTWRALRRLLDAHDLLAAALRERTAALDATAPALLDKAAELEQRLEAIRAELWQLSLPPRRGSGGSGGPPPDPHH